MEINLMIFKIAAIGNTGIGVKSGTETQRKGGTGLSHQSCRTAFGTFGSFLIFMICLRRYRSCFRCRSKKRKYKERRRKMSMLQIGLLGVAGALLAIQFKGRKNRIRDLYMCGNQPYHLFGHFKPTYSGA